MLWVWGLGVFKDTAPDRSQGFSTMNWAGCHGPVLGVGGPGIFTRKQFGRF